MTKTVFKIGDIVHHPKYGECTITNAGDYGTPFIIPSSGGGGLYEEIAYLSFEPWNKPVHKRPIEDGLYLVLQRQSNQVTVRRRVSGMWFYIDVDLNISEAIPENYDNYIIKAI